MANFYSIGRGNGNWGQVSGRGRGNVVPFQPVPGTSASSNGALNRSGQMPAGPVTLVRDHSGNSVLVSGLGPLNGAAVTSVGSGQMPMGPVTLVRDHSGNSVLIGGLGPLNGAAVTSVGSGQMPAGPVTLVQDRFGQFVWVPGTVVPTGVGGTPPIAVQRGSDSGLSSRMDSPSPSSLFPRAVFSSSAQHNPPAFIYQSWDNAQWVSHLSEQQKEEIKAEEAAKLARESQVTESFSMGCKAQNLSAQPNVPKPKRVSSVSISPPPDRTPGSSDKPRLKSIFRKD